MSVGSLLVLIFMLILVLLLRATVSAVYAWLLLPHYCFSCCYLWLSVPVLVI